MTKMKKIAPETALHILTEQSGSSEYHVVRMHVYPLYPGTKIADEHVPMADGAVILFRSQRDDGRARVTAGVGRSGPYGFDVPSMDDDLRDIARSLPLAKKLMAKVRELTEMVGEPASNADVVRRMIAVLKPRAIYLLSDGATKLVTQDAAVYAVIQHEHAWIERTSPKALPAPAEQANA